jgi:hypothetical protein
VLTHTVCYAWGSANFRLGGRKCFTQPQDVSSNSMKSVMFSALRLELINNRF